MRGSSRKKRNRQKSPPFFVVGELARTVPKLHHFCTISAPIFVLRLVQFSREEHGDRGDGRSEVMAQKRGRNSAETGAVEHDERTRRHTDRSCGATRPIGIEAFADITLIGHGILEWFRPNTGPTVVAANTGSERSIYSTAFWEGISAGHRRPAT